MPRAEMPECFEGLLSFLAFQNKKNKIGRVLCRC